MNPYLALTLLLCPLAAHAQAVPVAERMLTPARQGARADGFLLLPKATFEQAYNDNIYASSSNAKTDFITTARPQLAARSNWNNHALNALVGAEFNRYANHPKENTTNYTAALDGRLDVLRQTSLGGGIAWRRAHEDRGTPDSPATALHPIQFETTTARLGAYRGLGKLNARLDSELKKLAYQNGLTTTGASVNSSLRNRTEYAQKLRLGYTAAPGREAYLAGTLDNRVYEIKNPTNRSSRGSTAVAGINLDLGGKTALDTFAGYSRRRYSALKNISAPVYGLNLTWNATDLTTLLAHINRTLEETTLAGSSGYILSSYGAELQHALGRRWLASLGADYNTYQYKGTAASQRNDNVLSAQLGTTYRINNRLSASASYRASARGSNAAGGDYNRNLALIQLTAAL